MRSDSDSSRGRGRRGFVTCWLDNGRARLHTSLRHFRRIDSARVSTLCPSTLPTTTTELSVEYAVTSDRIKRKHGSQSTRHYDNNSRRIHQRSIPLLHAIQPSTIHHRSSADTIQQQHNSHLRQHHQVRDSRSRRGQQQRLAHDRKRHLTEPHVTTLNIKTCRHNPAAARQIL